ncbi:MAG TPA: glycoside hydrolase family 65 [Blastocatellia bacterium]|nr:glycoside hydrolase family 65 [Blastocatellia bacterium]
MSKRNLSRREFLSISGVGGLTGVSISARRNNRYGPVMGRALGTQDAIDRASLVARHCPVLRDFDPQSPLSLGNGEFAFTADVTGLQTFPEHYKNAVPLCTMSQWGWHTAPLSGLDPTALRLSQYDAHGRPVAYATSAQGQDELYKWLRENPHRMHLGLIGLRLLLADGREARVSDVAPIEQRLDLWSGLLTSRFTVADNPVTVRTAVHPKLDLLAVLVESPLIGEQKVAVRFSFPYGDPGIEAADWEKDERHRSAVIAQNVNQASIRRTIDKDEYFCTVAWTRDASFSSGRPHRFLLVPSRKPLQLEFVAAFTPRGHIATLPSVGEAFADAARHWQHFWTEGGAIELAASKDSRAPELERRVVLSQYLTAIQCSGSMPPQETGLTVNSWHGKFHLEMHWWHAAHFALWNRLPLLEKSLAWYADILPAARQRATLQGYTGARWPKMSGPEGRDSPSPIGPLLIWQQPHPIFYAELCYLLRTNRSTLERYRRIVLETAEFMASFAYFDPKTQRYVLGPPVIPAQENHPPRETWNPTYELAYWAWGLNVAQKWLVRSGQRRNAKWDDVIRRLSRLPVREGVYLAHENCPQTFTQRNYDHPSMLAALGALSGGSADTQIMRSTLFRVINEWQWDRTWGWDYPMAAMTAARLGERKTAVDLLTMQTEKNRYLPNGHNWQRRDLPCYLPGNGGLLYAVAMMAAGWDGAPHRRAPGFPDDGSWTVRSEGLRSDLLATL